MARPAPFRNRPRKGGRNDQENAGARPTNVRQRKHEKKGTRSRPLGDESPPPVIPSVTWALSPTIQMKVPHTVMLSAAKHLLFLIFRSRFFVAPFLRMTRLGDFRRSAAANLLLLDLKSRFLVVKSTDSHLTLAETLELSRTNHLRQQEFDSIPIRSRFRFQGFGQPCGPERRLSSRKGAILSPEQRRC